MSIMAFAGESPEKVWLGIELHIFSLDVDVKLWCPGVGYTNNHSKEIGILTQFKRRCYHDYTQQSSAATRQKKKKQIRKIIIQTSQNTTGMLIKFYFDLGLNKNPLSIKNVPIFFSRIFLIQHLKGNIIYYNII